MKHEDKATVYIDDNQCSQTNAEAPVSACEEPEAPEAGQPTETPAEAPAEQPAYSQQEYEQYKQYHDQTSAWVQQNRDMLTQYQEQREAFAEWQKSQQQQHQPEEQESYFEKLERLEAQQAEATKNWQAYQQKQAEQAFEAEAKKLQAEHEGVDFNKVYERFAEYDGRVPLAQVAAWVALESAKPAAAPPPAPTNVNAQRDGVPSGDFEKDLAAKMQGARDPWALVRPQ